MNLQTELILALQVVVLTDDLNEYFLLLIVLLVIQLFEFVDVVDIDDGELNGDDEHFFFIGV